MHDLVLRNATLVTLDSQDNIIEGDLGIDAGCITAMGAVAEKGHSEIDCAGKLVLPGFVQPHIHLCQTLFRNQADDMLLLDWLRTRIWPLEGAHTPDSLFASARLGIADLLLNGTTTLLDMGTVHHTQSIFEAIDAMGIRAIGGKCLMDQGELVPKSLVDPIDKALQENANLTERFHGAAQGRIGVATTPRFVLSCSKDLMREAGKYAQENNLLFHTHSSENQDELAAVQALYDGKNNIEALESLGCLSPQTVLAHCIWLNAHERQLLVENQTKVVHCPSSNMKLGSGFSPVPTLMNDGIEVGLAADGAPCSNNLDPFMEMRLAALIHKPAFGPKAMDAKTVLKMATLGGAKVLGLDKQIGTIELGKKADLISVRNNSIHNSPHAHVYGQLVYSCQSRDVCDVMVDGQVLVQDSQLTVASSEEIVSTAQSAWLKLKSQIDIF
jgi:5-methylthioadenosine/S-adenosylhomocysteine deaminase